MMEVSYMKDTYHTYMVTAGTEGNEIDDEERMLCNQQSAVLLPFHIQQINGRKDYYYEITGKLDFLSYIKKQQADLVLIRAVIDFLLKLYRAMDEYLLNPDGILLDVSCLYIEMDEKKLYAAYIPGMRDKLEVQLGQLAACLLENTDHTDREGVLLSYDFYKTVRREDFAPALLEGFLRTESGGRETSEYRKGGEAPQGVTGQEPFEMPGEENGYPGPFGTLSEKREAEKGEEKENKRKAGIRMGVWLEKIAAAGICLAAIVFYKTGRLRALTEGMGGWVDDRYVLAAILAGALGVLLIRQIVMPMRKKEGDKAEEEQEIWEDAAFENSGIYSFTDETGTAAEETGQDRTILLSSPEGTVRLISLNKKIAPDLVFSEFPCVVGSGEKEAQAIVSAIGVSRRHAVFEKIQTDVYVTDLYSTNGTCVNGEKLEPDEKRRLLVEDIIAFAGVRYMYSGGK